MAAGRRAVSVGIDVCVGDEVEDAFGICVSGALASGDPAQEANMIDNKNMIAINPLLCIMVLLGLFFTFLII